MASFSRRHADNAAGDFYVDSTCIDCDACRRIAPTVFGQAADHSFVSAQPASEADRRRALMALVACPTGSIGTVSRQDVRPGLEAFPEPIEENVSFSGFTAEKSFGAWSYLVERPEGNVLIDSPRAVPRLLAELERRGGISTMLLTHRDDVADHETFHRRFRCERVLHEADLSAAIPTVERPLVGTKPVVLAPDLLAIPTPGHTRGHTVFLYRRRFLFTGDHLAWSRRQNRLVAFRDACWYSWEEQINSMSSLLDIEFQWVLPGHGGSKRFDSSGEARNELARCIALMRGA